MRWHELDQSLHDSYCLEGEIWLLQGPGEISRSGIVKHSHYRPAGDLPLSCRLGMVGLDTKFTVCVVGEKIAVVLGPFPGYIKSR